MKKDKINTVKIADEELRCIRTMYKYGMTDSRVAEALGIQIRTLVGYKNKYPELREAINEGRKFADEQVEDSLFNLSQPYEYDEITLERTLVKEEKELDAKGNVIKTHFKYDMIPTKTVKKIILGNVRACELWLRNKKSREWNKDLEIRKNEEDNPNNNIPRTITVEYV